MSTGYTHAESEWGYYLEKQFIVRHLIPLAHREIIIAFQQGPDTMQMVRQHHPGIDMERVALPHAAHRLTQKKFVPNLLAMSSIVAAPAEYNVSLKPIANKPHVSEVEIGAPIRLVAGRKRGYLEAQDRPFPTRRSCREAAARGPAPHDPGGRLAVANRESIPRQRLSDPALESDKPTKGVTSGEGFVDLSASKLGISRGSHLLWPTRDEDRHAGQQSPHRHQRQ